MENRNNGAPRSARSTRNNKRITRRSELPIDIRFAGEFYGDTEGGLIADHVLTKKEREFMFIFSDASVLEANNPELHILVFLEGKDEAVPLPAKNKLRSIIKYLRQTDDSNIGITYSGNVLSYSSESSIKDELRQRLNEREKSINDELAANKDTSREAESHKAGKR